MEGNPYSEIVDRIKGKNGGGLIMYRGKVIKSLPLVISIAGIRASGNELMINNALLNAEREPCIVPEDTVLALTTDNQIFYILCKVVSL